MKLPVVSVLMTSYNREKYIAQAIESVLQSSLKEIELIIVDDGSSDKTVEIARGYEKSDSRVIVYQNPQNLGDYPNRNKAASYASGKYLKYVDSDDLIYPWALASMVAMMEQFPGAGWGLCSMEPNPEKLFPFELDPREAYEYHYLGPGLFKRAPLSAIIKRSVFDEVGGFKPIRMAGDFEMWHRLAIRYSVVLMPQGMVWYRTHNSQEVNDYRQFMHTYEKIKVQYLKAAENPLPEELLKQIILREKKRIKNYVTRNLLKLDFETLSINLKNLRLYSRDSPKNLKSQ